MATDYPRDDVNDVDVYIGRTTFQNRNYLAPAKNQAEIVLYDVVLKLLQNDQVVTGLMTTTTDLEVTAIDTNGERAEYTQQCHGLLARHRNQSIGRDDHFWTRGGPDQTVLCDNPEEVLRQLAEMFARPVEQNLVQEINHWEGAKITPDQWGREQTIYPHVQSDRATYAQPITFTPMPPAVLLNYYSLERARELANEAVATRVAELNATRLERTGKSAVLGRRGCNALDPLSKRDQPRRPPQPHFIGSKKQVEAAMKDLRDKRAFYAECRQLFHDGHKDVVFAAGTVMMRKLGAYCDPLPRSRIEIPPWEFARPPNTPTKERPTAA